MSFIETLHGGEFIIAELGALSRDQALVAAGLQLAAGTVVALDDDDELVRWSGSGSPAGILLYPTDTTEGAKAVAYIARRARVNLDLLDFPEGLAATTAAALNELTIIVSSDSAIVDTGGGGGGAPEWVPANAKIYIDLVNDRAWTEADGEVAINTLLGADSNTENGWAVSEYNVGHLTADGYVGNTDGKVIGFIGAARSKLLDAATTRVKAEMVADPYFASVQIALVSADGNDGVNVNCQVGDSGGGSYNGEASLVISNVLNFGVDGAINVVATTITADRLDISINGSDAVSEPLDHVTDRPTGNPFVAGLIDLGATGDKIALQSITIFDPLPSTAGLSALSATGVTNTAPTITNNPADFTPTFAEAAAVTGSTVATVTTADAEGNWVTFSLPVNVGSKFAVDASGVVTSTEDLLAGGSPYTFTLRATDPVGLYVEQEFTITVTA